MDRSNIDNLGCQVFLYILVSAPATVNTEQWARTCNLIYVALMFLFGPFLLIRLMDYTEFFRKYSLMIDLISVLIV